jgi:hypothetical protein
VEVEGHTPIVSDGIVLAPGAVHRMSADGALVAILHVATIGRRGRGAADFGVRALSVVAELDTKLKLRQPTVVRDARIARMLDQYPHAEQELLQRI